MTFNFKIFLGDMNLLENEDEEYEIDLAHYTQNNTWDCGISCIMMVLPQRKRNFFIENFEEICQNENFGLTTWTIDLCYLLKKFSVNFIFYTKVAGVNPKLKSLFFYDNILEKDTERVTRRFENAEKNGIQIRLMSLKSQTLINHINKFGPIILLTNAGYLHCDDCKRNVTTSKLIQYLPKSVAYHGHYVVLCGYNLKKRQFYYRNPTETDRTCTMKISDMNKARKCFGTDEDCILIFSEWPLRSWRRVPGRQQKLDSLSLVSFFKLLILVTYLFFHYCRYSIRCSQYYL